MDSTPRPQGKRTANGHSYSTVFDLASKHDQIVKLVEEGLSSGDIVGRLGGGVTRSAVIGYLARRGIKLARSTGPRSEYTPRPARTRSTKPPTERRSTITGWKLKAVKPASMPATPKGQWPVPANGGHGVPFLERGARQCARPLWGLSERTGAVCGLPKPEDRAYCAGCHPLLYGNAEWRAWKDEQQNEAKKVRTAAVKKEVRGW